MKRENRGIITFRCAMCGGFMTPWPIFKMAEEEISLMSRQRGFQCNGQHPTTLSIYGSCFLALGSLTTIKYREIQTWAVHKLVKPLLNDPLLCG